MKKSNIIEGIMERLNILEKPVDKKAKPKKGKVDEEVCPICGGDFLFVEEGLVYCKICDEYYEEDEEQ